MNSNQHGLTISHLSPSSQSTPNLPFNNSTSSLEKPYKSFFKRPIRAAKRDKKAPPSPLIVHPDPSSSIPIHTTNSPLQHEISFNQTISTPKSQPIISPHHLTSSPHITRASSSPHTTSKFNSLLTAAARSIRTGDSRLFESFQAALSPRPLDSTVPVPTSHPPASKNFNPHSLKRIPVPSYNPRQIIQPKTESLARATSLERPRTATKHSRTSSLPYSQVTPDLEIAPISSLKSPPFQNLAESVENLSEPQQKLVDLFDPLLPQSPFHTKLTPTLQSDHRLTQRKSDLSPASSHFDSAFFNPGLSNHPNNPSSSTPPSARRTDSNITFEQSYEIASKSQKKSSTDDYHQSSSPPIPCLPQLGPIPLRASSFNHLFNLYSPTGSASGSNPRPNDFLKPEKKNLGAREAQRRSFANMPLPALPPPCSPTRTRPAIRPLLKIPPMIKFKNRQTAGFQILKKQNRPWSIAGSAIYHNHHQGENSLCIDPPPINRKGPLTSADQAIFNTARASPLKLSTLTPQNRHSYPPPSNLNLSPLERISDHLKSVYSNSQSGHKLQLLNLSISNNGSIQQRENEALRLSPCITSPCGNLMFGYRGEVYELDNKYQKSNVLDQSIKARVDSDPRNGLTSPSHEPSPHRKSIQALIDQNSKPRDLVDYQDGSLTRLLPSSSNSAGGISRNSISYPTHRTKVVPALKIRTQPDFEELGELIELNEICLIGSDHLDLPLDHSRASGLHLNPAEESLVIEPSSPRNSERNSSTEIVLESLSVDRGSSEEESSRLMEESMKFESGPEPKIINPETSLEMAASILGQPVPLISKEIREGFERIQYLFSDARSRDSVEKDKQQFITKMLKSIDHKIRESLKTSDASVQTDPVEFVTSGKNSNAAIFQLSSMMIPKINNRRMADTLKKLTNRTEHSDHSKENLPLNLTRYSVQSEQSFATVNWGYGGAGSIEDQQESLRTSGGVGLRSPRFDYTTERPSLRKQRSSGMSDSNQRFSSTCTSCSKHNSQQYSQHSPLMKNTGESHLGLQSNSSGLNESVLDALDKALRAEESFQREKQHLQGVARRQSQTIESLLIDKEVLSLEVSRLTGLVELLARDHNLLNDRIDKAEQAFDKFPPSFNRTSVHPTQTPDDTINYFTAATGSKIKKNERQTGKQEEEEWSKSGRRRRRSKRNGGELTETDEGIMAGDSEDWEQGMDHDGESLCDPEQSSLLLDHHHLSFEFIVDTSKDNLDPIPGSYPLLTPPKPRALSEIN